MTIQDMVRRLTGQVGDSRPVWGDLSETAYAGTVAIVIWSDVVGTIRRVHCNAPGCTIHQDLGRDQVGTRDNARAWVRQHSQWHQNQDPR